MAKTSIYLDEAFETLQKLSADDKKRLEYEARDKALKDYHSYWNSAKREGQMIGEAIGEKRGLVIGERRGREIGENAGIQLSCNVLTNYDQGLSIEDIVSKYNTTTEIVHEILRAANKL